MRTPFAVGDKVYFPPFGWEVYTLTESPHPATQYNLQLKVNGVSTTFHRMGMNSSTQMLPVLFHANAKNKENLEKLYGFKFGALNDQADK